MRSNKQIPIIKYLGVIFDDKLTWKPQIESMCSKLSNICGVLSKVRHYLDRKSLMMIYNSLFESRLRYGLLGWGTASEYYMSKLRVLQNRAVRFITFAPFHFHVIPLFSALEVLPLDDIMFLQKSIFMHNLHYKRLPFMLSSYCLPVTHTISTRYLSNLNYKIPLFHTNRGQKSIKYSGPKAWSLIPKTIKEIAYKKPFSRKMKSFLLNILAEKSRNTPAQSEIPPWHVGTSSPNELQILFDTSDNETFYGFDVTGTFEGNSKNKTLHGFDVTSLTNIFANETSDETFYGFDVLSLTNIFGNDTENSVFLGFS